MPHDDTLHTGYLADIESFQQARKTKQHRRSIKATEYLPIVRLCINTHELEANDCVAPRVLPPRKNSLVLLTAV